MEYNIFTCNDDGTVTFGELCDSNCGECELAMEDEPNMLCFVNENTVHVVSCSEDFGGDVLVMVYGDNGDLDCTSDLSGETYDEHLQASGVCLVDEHDHDNAGA